MEKARTRLDAAYRILRTGVLAAATLWGGSCGSSVTQAPAPSPAPVGPFANVSGNWTGTLETANLAQRTVTMTVAQGGNCVDGVWSSTPPGWTGAISGFASTDSFSGQFSFERTAEDGGKCSAVGSISGPVGASTLRWTSDGLTATGACAGAIPQTLVLTLQRQ